MELKGILFAALLIMAAVFDLRRREIPNAIPVLILIAGLWGIKPIPAVLGLVITGVPYLFAALLFRRREGFAIGGGDIKLMAACGFVLGAWGGIFQSIISLTLALIAGLIICLFSKGKKLNTVTLPLAPFFCAGGIFSYCMFILTAKN